MSSNSSSTTEQTKTDCMQQMLFAVCYVPVVAAVAAAVVVGHLQ
jgi:hypothetical protein